MSPKASRPSGCPGASSVPIEPPRSVLASSGLHSVLCTGKDNFRCPCIRKRSIDRLLRLCFGLQVQVCACRSVRTRIDWDLHAFRAVLGRWTVANSAFCNRPKAQIFNVGINTCCCCRAKIHSLILTLHLTCHKITSDAAIIRPPRLSSPTTLSYYGSYWKTIERASCCAGGKKGGMCRRCRGW